MFIGPCAENRFLPLERMEALENICQDEGIKMTNMWRYHTLAIAPSFLRDPYTGVDVEDGTCNVIRLLEEVWCRKTAGARQPSAMIATSPEVSGISEVIRSSSQRLTSHTEKTSLERALLKKRGLRWPKLKLPFSFRPD